jgi:cysteine desulfurase
VVGAAGASARPERRRGLVITAVEHPSVREPARALAAEGGLALTELPVDGRGRLDLAAAQAALDGDTLLLSVIAANNETGVLSPVAEVAALARRAGALVHVDASQALGRVAVDVAAWGADLVTVSSHKLGGPRGVGALWVRRGLALAPLVRGGPQERGRRAGTPDVAAAAGFGAACEAATACLSDESARLGALRDGLWRLLARDVPGALRLGDPEACLPNTLSVAFEGAHGETLLMALDLAGLSVSSGSACTAGSLAPSHVLLAMGLSPALAGSALRVSLGHATTAAEVAALAAALPPIVARARAEEAP